MESTALFAIFALFEASAGGAGTLRNRYQPGIIPRRTGVDETILTDAARFAMFFSALGNKSKRRTWYDWMKGTNGTSAKGEGLWIILEKAVKSCRKPHKPAVLQGQLRHPEKRKTIALRCFGCILCNATGRQRTDFRQVKRRSY